MWHVYVFGFLAGLLGANGVPHFVRGISGKKYMTPFGKDSSAAMNVVWGWLNFVVAGILIYYSHFHMHQLRAFASGAVGVLVAGLVMASIQAQTHKRK